MSGNFRCFLNCETIADNFLSSWSKQRVLRETMLVDGARRRELLCYRENGFVTWQLLATRRAMRSRVCGYLIERSFFRLSILSRWWCNLSFTLDQLRAHAKCARNRSAICDALRNILWYRYVFEHDTRLQRVTKQYPMCYTYFIIYTNNVVLKHVSKYWYVSSVREIIFLDDMSRRTCFRWTETCKFLIVSFWKTRLIVFFFCVSFFSWTWQKTYCNYVST